MTPKEGQRLAAAAQGAPWRRWGPYLAERAWGTVREDYSADQDAWNSFPHDHARFRAYRWNEDGLLGWSDEHQRLCFALGLWNGVDGILKERLFGLAGPEGNHGEDVKEVYFYTDGAPTHSYMRALYRYPQAAFPYEELLAENLRRTKEEPEFELLETGIFDADRYFDVDIEYAKAGPLDTRIAVHVTNHGPDQAICWVLPILWYRNAWSWGRIDPAFPEAVRRPRLRLEPGRRITAEAYRGLAPCQLAWEVDPEAVLFTENETNTARLFGTEGPRYAKDAFGTYLIDGDRTAVRADHEGSKATLLYRLDLAPGETATLRFRLAEVDGSAEPVASPHRGAAAGQEVIWPGFDALIAERRDEAREFYDGVLGGLAADRREVARQALAGLLWSKQYYHYVVHEWLEGDPAEPPPPAVRREGRNSTWRHLHCGDVLLMPDKWEYPWFAAWDLAFHCVALALVDPELAKEQLLLLLREWYLHPSGQLPAYEWALSDVNPPVHAWAALRVYQMEKRRTGTGDRLFLERVFHKLLLNFTWWINREDAFDNDIFEGGFLGLDNIGVFDRSRPLPTGGVLEQSDSTAWMAMYTIDMLEIALELARENPAYEDVASKFLEHFVRIAHAMNAPDGSLSLWDDEDGFYYDLLRLADGADFRVKVRSAVGLISLLAVGLLEPDLYQRLPHFGERLRWFILHRPDLTSGAADLTLPGEGDRQLLALLDADRLRRLLSRLLDEAEFLSPYGIRSLSRFHADHPYELDGGAGYVVRYDPAESTTGLFGGNSNWRGPVWMPLNFLWIEALRTFHAYLGDSFTVEFPTGSGRQISLAEVADRLAERIISLFLPDATGRRPQDGEDPRFASDPRWRDPMLFYEYFHGDTGRGLGASHQTGWTALVAVLLAERVHPVPAPAKA